MHFLRKMRSVQTCSDSETLLHVLVGCKAYFDVAQFTWRYDSVLNILASTLTAVQNSTLYVDLPGFMNLRSLVIAFDQTFSYRLEKNVYTFLSLLSDLSPTYKLTLISMARNFGHALNNNHMR